MAYLITNLINGKQYVGVTSRSIKTRWKQHIYQSRTTPKGSLAKAIIKYGAEAFSIEHVASSWSVDAMFELEVILIDQFDAFTKGYNSTRGGIGGRGYRHTAKARAAISRNKIGWNPTTETRARMSVGAKDREITQAFRDAQSVIMKRRLVSGERLLDLASDAKKERGRRARASGMTGVRRYDAPLSDELTRTGGIPVRPIEVRNKFREARLAVLERDGAAALEMAGKITATNAAEIKWLSLSTGMRNGAIGKLYGITHGQVSNINTGRSWRAVSPLPPNQG